MGVDQSVQTAAVLAEGAVVVVEAAVIGQIGGLEDGDQLHIPVLQMIHGAEQTKNILYIPF